MTDKQSTTSLYDIDRAVARHKEFCLDLETTGLDPFKDRIRGVAVMAGDEAVYLPLLGPGALPQSDVLMKVQEWMQWPDKVWINHNVKFDLKFLIRNGVDVRCQIIDTWVAAYVLDEERAGSSRLALKGKGGVIDEEFSVVLETFAQSSMKGGMLPGMAKAEDVYACDDVKWTMRLWKERFKSRIDRDPKIRKFFYEVQMPMVKILAGMELRGCEVDTMFLLDARKTLVQEKEAVSKRIFELAGTEFNIGSPAELGRILFGQMAIPRPPGSLTKGGSDSVGIRTLAQLWDYEIVREIYQWRARDKMLSTYVDKLYELAMADDNHRIHTDFWLAGTTSGRLSSRNPNIENLPRSKGEKWQYRMAIKKAFVAPEGFLLGCLDYSQLELRLMAHQSQDPTMLEIYHQKNEKGEYCGDIHDTTQKGLKLDDRTLAKQINFGLLYGMQAKRFSSMLWTQSRLAYSVSQCDKWIRAFFELYSGIDRYHKYIRQQLADYKTVWTILGRPRRLRTLYGADPESAFRVGTNHTIQGSAAEIVLIAMRNIQRKWEADPDYWRGCALLNQVHDELLFEAPEGRAKEAVAMVKDCMDNAIKLSVPLEATVGKLNKGLGRNWEAAKE